MEKFRSRGVYVLLALFIAISFTYQVLQCVSFVIGYYDLRHQAKAPFELDFARPVISTVTERAKTAGLDVRDTVESLNGVAFSGRALWQEMRWRAHPGDVLRLGVRKPDGRDVQIVFPLQPESARPFWTGESIFLCFILMVVPLFCLLLGYWVVIARPYDLNAWLILILLTYPQIYASVGTFNWVPGLWLVLRLNWHIAMEIVPMCALGWLGLLFPQRSALDVKVPWLKWLLVVICGAGTATGLATDYCAWYDPSLINNWPAVDRWNDRVLNWTAVFCVALYWFAISQKLLTTKSADSRRRLRVLFAGSVIGLGSVLVIWGLLPLLGLVNPAANQSVGWISAVLMLAFPLSLAYVVIVQRAMDVSILIRLGTRYLLARTTLLIVQLVGVVAIIWSFLVPAIRDAGAGKARLILPVFAIAAIIWLIATRRSPSERLMRWLDRKFFREAYDAEVVLGELADHARTITEAQKLIDTVSQRISDVLHIRQIAVLLRAGNSFQLCHSIGIGSDGLMAIADQASVVKQLESTNSPAVVYGHRNGNDAGADVLDNMAPDVLLPLPGRSRLMGVMALGSKQSEEPYTPTDLRLLKSVGLQTGLALEVSALAQSLADEMARRAKSEREIEIAHEVQQRLFPQKYPEVAGLSLAGACRPAQGVGGDYYDVIELPAGRIGLAIGDVSGKGISAALIMAGIRSCLRTLTLDEAGDLGAVMQKLNRLVYESSAINRYATFFFAVYHPDKRELRYVNAGHNSPVVLRPSSEGCFTQQRLEGGGTVIGLLAEAAYEEQRLNLEPGDVLLAYTDGISEAMTEADEEWGEERMIAAAESGCGQNAEQMLRAMFDAADRFTGGAPQYDDMTMLIAKLA